MLRRFLVYGTWALSAALLLSCSKDTRRDSQGEGKAIGGDDLSPECIAVDDGVVYFTESGSSDRPKGIKKSAVGENSSTMLATANLDPSFLVTNGKHVWWVEHTGTTSSILRRVPVSGGTAEVIDDSRINISALAIDGYNVYYSEKSNGAIYRVPLEGGDPILLYTANQDVLVAMTADGQYVYFSLAFDAPSGQILRIPVGGGAGPTTVVTGLGAPFSLTVDDREICWRELQLGKIGCAPKAGGGTATTLATGQSFVPRYGYVLAMNETLLFYSSGKEIRRLARAAGGTPEVVARAGQFVYSIDALAIDATNVYWSEGDSLRQIAKSHLSASTPDGGNVTASCSSDYNGQYFGKFLYQYDAGDPNQPPLTTVVASITVTLTFKCLATAAGSTVLTVTHALVDDPYFECQLEGCTPLFPSVANLPATPPTTPSSPSQSGQGIAVFFPNGTTLLTTNTAGALNVTGGGRILSNSLDPAFEDDTWVVGNANSGLSFPTQRREGTPVVRFKSWQLDHSALP